MGSLAVAEDAYGVARNAWPAIELAPDSFWRYLEEHPEQTRPDQLAELYIARACAEGDSAALAEFDRAYLTGVPAALARMKLDRADVGEVTQLVRQKLFVAADGQRPKIEEYAGRGELPALIRVIAVRTAISLIRKRKKTT